jgi:hypothetical protein
MVFYFTIVTEALKHLSSMEIGKEIKFGNSFVANPQFLPLTIDEGKNINAQKILPPYFTVIKLRDKYLLNQ